MIPVRLPRSLDGIDARIERVVTARPGGVLDTLAHGLSAAADRSRLWVALAALRAVRGRPNDRLAAARMVAVVGVESAVVHGLVKRLFARARPEVEVSLRFGARRPPSTSFPSGHAASAITAAGLIGDRSRARPVLLALACVVGWSRVQTRLHHPSDVVAGWATGLVVTAITRRLLPLPDKGGR